MKKTFKSFFIFLIFFAGFLALLITAIHLPSIQKQALNYLAEHMKKTNQSLEFENLGMDFPFKIKAEKIIYISAQKDQVILKDIFVDINISSILKGRPYIKSISLNDLRINPASAEQNKAIDLTIYNDARDILYIIHQNYVDQGTIKNISFANFSENFSAKFNRTLHGPELKIFEQTQSPLFLLNLATVENMEVFTFKYFHNRESAFLNHLFSFLEKESSALEKIIGHIKIDAKRNTSKALLDAEFIFSNGHIIGNAKLNDLNALFVEMVNTTPLSLPFFGQLDAVKIDIKQFSHNMLDFQNSWIKGKKNSLEISGNFKNNGDGFKDFSLKGECCVNFSLMGDMINQYFSEDKIPGNLTLKIENGVYNLQLESPLTSVKSKFLKVLLSDKLKVSAEIDAEATSFVFQGLKGSKIKINSDNQYTNIIVSLEKKVEQTFLENIKIAIKKQDENYLVKGFIQPIGKNFINMDFLFDPIKNIFLKGHVTIDIKDMAPLTTPFDFATVGEVMMKIIFKKFSLTEKSGMADINFESKFFRSPIFKSAFTTLKGIIGDNLNPELKLVVEELAIGKNFLAQQSTATLKSRDDFYLFNVKAHSHKKGYLSSDLDILLDVDLEKDGRFLKINNIDIYHLKQKVKIKEPFRINLNPFSLQNAQLIINDGFFSFHDIFEPTPLKPFWGGDINLHAVPLGVLSWITPKTLMTGQVDGKISLKGKQDVPDFSLLLKGQKVQWRQLHTDSSIKESFLSFEISGDLIDKILTYSADLKGKNLASCLLKGRVPTNINSLEPLECFFKGSVNLALISFIISTSDRLKGNINFDLHLNGLINDPVWKGEISTNDAYLELAEFGTIINNIKGKIIAQHKKWTVQKITADDTPLQATKKKWNPGSLILDGTFYFDTLLSPSIDLSLKLSRYLIVNTDSLKGMADALLKIKGEGIFSEISGTANIHQLRVDLARWDTDDSIPSIDLRDPKKRQYAKDYQKENFDKSSKPILPLNIMLKTNGKLSLISDNIRESLWRGDVAVQGSITDPYLNGSVTLLKGVMILLDKALIIENGKVTFSEHDPNEPWFTILASRKIGDISIRVFIDNKQDPMLTFDSSPSMSQSDILSWLLFGKDALTISAGESIQLAMAISQVSSNKVLSSVFNPIEDFRKILGFDTLEIRGQDASKSSNIEQNSRNVVHLGKKITDSIEVSVEQGTNQNTTSIGAEMDVGHNVVIDADLSKSPPDNTNAGRSTGVGFRWGKRY